MRRNALDSMDLHALGERLAEARKACGKTQQDAAEALGVARTSVTAIEKGQRRIQARELAQLAQLYGRPVNELLQPALLGKFAPRLRAAAGIQSTDPALVPAISDLRDLCQDYVRLEDLCKAPLQYRYPEPYDRAGLSPVHAGDDLALLERNRLGLGDGPVLELRQVLEGDVGLRIFLMRLPPRVSEMYEYDERAGGCVALNRGHPPERRRWSLAHAYGHFLAGRYQPEVAALPAERRAPDEERFADAFARSFLMPAAGLRQRFHALIRGRQPTVADVLVLAHRYGVSAEAMARRLESLGLLREGAWEQILDAGLKVRQAQAALALPPPPDDEEAPPRHSAYVLPMRYRSLAARAYDQALISESQLARFLRTDPVDARATVQALREQAGLVSEDETLGTELALAAGLAA